MSKKGRLPQPLPDRACEIPQADSRTHAGKAW